MLGSLQDRINRIRVRTDRKGEAPRFGEQKPQIQSVRNSMNKTLPKLIVFSPRINPTNASYNFKDEKPPEEDEEAQPFSAHFKDKVAFKTFF